MSNKLCAFPWVHMSANQQGEMIICCNTYESSPMKKNNGNVWQLKDITDPLEYFNSNHYKEIRLGMLQGEEPEYCKKCYDIERNGGRSIRQNSLDENKIDSLLEKTDLDTGEIKELTLSYVHFMWGNKCNLKCKMCDPHSSDQLIEEFRQMGIPHYNYNYIASLNDNWSYENNIIILEKIAPYIRVLNVTGGEPLINNDFLEYCYYLNDNGYSKNIKLSFHTNLTVLPSKFVETWKNFASITVKISIDATEKDYEYIRYPGKWNIIKKNITELVEIADKIPQLGVEFHTVFSTFNAHAIPNLIKYLLKIQSRKFLNFPNTLLVTTPDYADSRCIPVDVKKQIEKECLEIIQQLPEVDNKRIQHCIDNLKSNLKYMLSDNFSQTQFYKFNTSQDILRTIKTEEVVFWSKP